MLTAIGSVTLKSEDRAPIKVAVKCIPRGKQKTHNILFFSLILYLLDQTNVNSLEYLYQHIRSGYVIVPKRVIRSYSTLNVIYCM